MAASRRLIVEEAYWALFEVVPVARHHGLFEGGRGSEQYESMN
jgi:hypothetical protein